MNSNGKTANLSGQNAETIIDCVMQILRNKGYGVVSQYSICLAELLNEPLTSDTVRVDFLVTGITEFETGLIVSSKRQDSGGSAQEKIVYSISYLIPNVYPYPTILVMTGNAWHSNLIRYVKSAIDKKKLIDVFLSYEELLQWAEALPKIKKENILKSLKNLPLFEDF